MRLGNILSGSEPSLGRRGGPLERLGAVLEPSGGSLGLAEAAGAPTAVSPSGSSFASHISLSSARPRCHCAPFPHALIPAL
eukprot:7825866-Pyramimonas_sp.AAC.1